MRSKVAVYVDAGYLIAASGTRVAGTSLRSATVVDHSRLVRGVMDFVQEHAGLSLLRLQWYDAAVGGQAGLLHLQIASIPRVKVRLGRISPNGEQKVDLRLGLDIASTARNGAVESIYVLSGDDDLSEAVEVAQELGVHVAALCVAQDGRPLAVSRHLQTVVDEIVLLPDDLVTSSVAESLTQSAQQESVEVAGNGASATGTGRSAPSPALVAARAVPRVAAPPRVRPPVTWTTSTGAADRQDGVAQEDDIEEVVRALLQGLWRVSSAQTLAAMLDSRPVVPPDIDSTLLRDLSARVDVYEIPTADRHRMREVFWEQLTALVRR